MAEPLYYSEYLALEELLKTQKPKSALNGNMVHDEMLFIVVHQVYELWFKQIQFEMDSIITILQPENVNDSDEIQKIVSRLKRCIEIWKLLINQYTVLETMAPGDFFDFRKYLLPASGFQSLQFKQICAKMGLRPSGTYYKHTNEGGLNKEDREKLDYLENSHSLLKLTNSWLERTPFLLEANINVYWSALPDPLLPADKNTHPFFNIYLDLYALSIAQTKSKDAMLDEFKQIFFNRGTDSFSPAAMRSALFITLYRHHPIFHLPFEILNSLIEMDELISNWLYRHLLMVRRMIGMREGTGGTSGAGFLEESLKKTRVFKDLAILPTYMIEKGKLPVLPKKLIDELNFKYYIK